MNEHYWGLPTLSHFIRWLEEMVAILSKPFLMVGFIVSMLDLLTHGQLLSLSFIYYGWALIQAIAVDATFFVVWHKVKVAATSGRWISFVGYTLLGLALGVVAWAAMDIQSLEQALGVDNAEALARLNLNPVMLTHLRSVVAVIMGGVVAMISPDHTDQLNTSTMKHPGKVSTWFRSIGQRLGVQSGQGNQVVTAPLPAPIDHPEEVTTEQVTRAQLDTLNTVPFEHFAEGWTAYTLQTSHLIDADPFSHIEYGIASVSPVVISSTSTAIPPIAQSEPATVARRPGVATASPVATKKPTRKGIHMVEETSTPEQRIRLAHAEHPEYSDRQLAKLAQCSPATATKWRKRIEQAA